MDEIISMAGEAASHPLALPIAVGVATVIFTVLLFYSVAEGSTDSPIEKVIGAEVAGTTVIDGVRRSTR